MPKLDQLREEVAYLKFWLGVMVVTDVGLVGWLIVAVDDADRLRIVLAVFGIVLLSFGALILHREVAHRMKRIGRL